MTAPSIELEERLATAETLYFKGMLEESFFDRISRRIAKEEGVSTEAAKRIFDGALGFLKLCAIDPVGNYSPSPIVDIGWHAFMMYTRGYQEFCQRVAGRFIHHEPCDVPGDEIPVRDTVNGFIQYNIQFHPDQWKLAGAGLTCTGNGCMNNG